MLHRSFTRFATNSNINFHSVFRSGTVIVVTVIGRFVAGVLDSVVRLAHENGLPGGGSERELGVRRRQRQHAGAETGVAVPRLPIGLSVARDHDRFVQGRA